MKTSLDSSFVIISPISFIVLLFILLFFVISLNDSLGSLILPHYFSYDRQRIFELILLISTIALVLISFKQTCFIADAFFSFPKVSILVLFSALTVGVISSLMAPLPKMGFLEVSHYVLLVGFGLIIASQRKVVGNKFDIYLTGLMILIAIWYGFYFLYNVKQHWIFPNFPSFENVRFFSEFQIGTLALLAIPLSIPGKKIRLGYLFLWALLAFWWYLAIVSGTKSLWLAYFLSFVAVFVRYKKQARRFICIQITAIVVGIIIDLLFHQNTSISHSTNVLPFDSSVTSRIIMAKQAFYLIQQHPILGVGPMHFAYYVNPIAANPHNAVLLLASEWGFPICFVLMLITGWGVITWFKKYNMNTLIVTGFQEGTGICLSSAIIAIIINALMGSAIVTPLSQVMLSIIFGWSIGFYQGKNYTKNTSPSSNYNYGLFVLLLVAAATFLVVIVFPQIPTLTEREITWYLSQPTNSMFHPRFWSQGWIYRSTG